MHARTREKLLSSVHESNPKYEDVRFSLEDLAFWCSPFHSWQKVNCVQFNEEATVILSGGNDSFLTLIPVDRRQVFWKSYGKYFFALLQVLLTLVSAVGIVAHADQNPSRSWTRPRMASQVWRCQTMKSLQGKEHWHGMKYKAWAVQFDFI